MTFNSDSSINRKWSETTRSRISIGMFVNKAKHPLDSLLYRWKIILPGIYLRRSSLFSSITVLPIWLNGLHASTCASSFTRTCFSTLFSSSGRKDFHFSFAPSLFSFFDYLVAAGYLECFGCRCSSDFRVSVISCIILHSLLLG